MFFEKRSHETPALAIKQCGLAMREGKRIASFKTFIISETTHFRTFQHPLSG